MSCLSQSSFHSVLRNCQSLLPTKFSMENVSSYVREPFLENSLPRSSESEIEQQTQYMPLQ